MLWRYANGLDDDEIMKNDYKRDIKSVGNSTTPSSDMRNIKDVSGVMHSLAASVASRLRKYELLGTVVQIWVRDKNLNSYEKQRVLFEPSNNEKEIYETALELFRESYNWHAAIRSVGVRCTKLISKNEGIQLSIFDDCEKLDREKKLDNTVDEINRRYGSGAIKRLVELNGDLGNFDPSRTEGGICGKPGSELK